PHPRPSSASIPRRRQQGSRRASGSQSFRQPCFPKPLNEMVTRRPVTERALTDPPRNREFGMMLEISSRLLARRVEASQLRLRRGPKAPAVGIVWDLVQRLQRLLVVVRRIMGLAEYPVIPMRRPGIQPKGG